MKGRALFWWRWLIVVTVGVLLAGITMVVAPDLTQQLFSLLIFSSAQSITAFGEPAVSYIALVHGVLGAVMCGWGMALLFTLLGPFRHGSREAWLTLSVSVAAWFIPDTLFSMWTGYWQNAVLNGVLAILFVVPLVATRGMCTETRT